MVARDDESASDAEWYDEPLSEEGYPPVVPFLPPHAQAPGLTLADDPGLDPPSQEPDRDVDIDDPYAL